MNYLPESRPLKALAAAIALSTVALAAHAQEALEEIIVVSQKRAAGMSVQDVASSITAIDASAMENAFTVNLVDVGRMVPNVQLNQVSTFNGYPNFYIRGIGINGSTRSVDPAVGLFVDGIYIGYGPSSLIDTFDLASVEVLRGPQGTLFGRNVTGGAVVANTKRPIDEFEADLKLGAGEYDRLDVAGSVNVPMGDAAAFRIASIYQHMDGYFRNLENGDRKARKEQVLVRPSLKLTPTDTLDITLIGEYMHNDGGAATSQNIVNPKFPKLAQTLFGYVPPDDKYDIRHNLHGYSDSETRQLILDSNWDVGHGVVTGIVGWRDVEFDSSTDFDGSPITLFHFPDNEETQDQTSVELRYASTFSEVVDFTVGLYWFEQDFFVGEQRDTFGGVAAGTIRTIGRTDQEQSQEAAFTQGTWHLSDKWSVVAGVRYTKEKKEIEFTPPGVKRCAPDFSGCTLVLDGDEDWDSVSPKLGVNYQLDDETLIYASWIQSSRSGVFNARAQRAEFLGPSEPEEVDSYELGIKTDLFDKRLRVNAAVFTMAYDDIQKIINESFDPDGAGPQPPTSGQVVANAAEATISGMELEISALVTDAFSVNAAFGYTDAAYDEFAGQDVNGDGVPDPDLAEDLEFEKVPETTVFLGGNYVIDLPNADELTLRASWNYTDKFYTDTLNRPWLSQDGYGLYDASITYAHGDVWQLSLWGKNLSDEEYIDFAADVGALGSWVFGGEPRHFGVELRAWF
ncbi:MAG: TonB-dependent receptor [Steroidobacteraceae bacterium]|nr:TonB-dependent receptor [Steroidobacteraceae bacterium]